MRIRVNGGGHVAQIYAIRQAMSKALVAYYQKCKSSKSLFYFEIKYLCYFETYICHSSKTLIF